MARKSAKSGSGGRPPNIEDDRPGLAPAVENPKKNEVKAAATEKDNDNDNDNDNETTGKGYTAMSETDKYGSLMSLPLVEMIAKSEQRKVGKDNPRMLWEQTAYYRFLDGNGYMQQAQVKMLLPRDVDPYQPGLYTLGGGAFRVEQSYGSGKLVYDPFKADFILLDKLLSEIGH